MSRSRRLRSTRPPNGTGGPRRHLFDCWPKVARRLQRARHVALFLDFDGTLTPLRRRPEQVVVDETTRVLLGRLARRPGFTVCVISGRRRADVRKRLNVRGVQYLGLHGAERNTGRLFDRAQHQVLASAKRLVAAQLSRVPGVWMEDKGPAFVVHHRIASGEARQLRAMLQRALAPFATGLRVLPGHNVWEVLPRAAAGKGEAVRAEMAGLPAHTLPVYVGDDVTDESAFAVLGRGVTVRVGTARRSTRARYRLRNTDEVTSFLKQLDAGIASGVGS